MTAQEATDLISGLSAIVSSNTFGDARSREEAIRLSKLLTAALQEPASAAVELAFSTFTQMSARIAVDLDLFKYIIDHEGPGPITTAELANLSGAESLLISRVLKPLVGVSFVREAGEESWESTPISEAMTKEGIAAGHRVLWELLVGAAAQTPKYFQEAGYRCPTNPDDGLIQYAFRTKLQFFKYVSSIPHVLSDFNSFMGNTMGARMYWVDWYPVPRILEGATDEYPLIVDVGGGKGHDLEAFHAKFPNRGRLILQDLPHVVKGVKELNPNIERWGYDFFTPQPVKNARVYFYHHILHDWSDYKCLEILDGVKTAMKPGYSILMLHELIVPEQGATSFHAALDLTMMTFNCGMERTGKQWKDLMDRAGFEVVKLWVPDGVTDADSIVEAVLKQE